MLTCLQQPATAHAQVTVVVLLSQPTEFKGGINFFEPGWKGGDALLQKAVANYGSPYSTCSAEWMFPVACLPECSGGFSSFSNTGVLAGVNGWKAKVNKVNETLWLRHESCS